MAYDILPYPNITATNPEDQLRQINDYLIQLKEILEFELTNISAENLSPELTKKLDELGSGIETTAQEHGEQMQQITSKSLTVLDVINSEAFKSIVPENYLASVKEEVQGTNTLYIFTNENDETVTIKIPNTL